MTDNAKRARPFTLDVTVLPKVWGGSALSRLIPKAAEVTKAGEAWLCSDLSETSLSGAGGQAMVSRVVAGWRLGASLSELMATSAKEILGRSVTRFPLLVKILDAAEHLSVQVHPSAAYAQSHPGAHRKSEAWYVISGAANAELMVGTRGIKSPVALRDAVESGRLVGALDRRAAKPATCVTIPSGVVHALGAGCTVFEVQTASDTTFRLYDWTSEYGRAPREMHVAQGLEAADLSATGSWSSPESGVGVNALASTPDFDFLTIRKADGVGISALLSGDGPQEARCVLLMPLGHGAHIQAGGEQYPLMEYAITVIPAADLSRWSIVGSDSAVLMVVVK